MTTAWTAAHLARLRDAALPELPLIAAVGSEAIVPGRVLWDLWPVADRDGRVAPVAGGELWMALSAPVADDPLARHAVARIRLLSLRGDRWRDLGDAMPDGHSPGSREWSGSAVLDGDRLTLFFTAAGRRGEARPTFEQRLFEARARLRIDDDATVLTDWSTPLELVAADGAIYVRADQAEGEVGAIKAFRDPAWFRDPADGAERLLFTASLAASRSPFNGAIGVARRIPGGGWALQPPLIAADGVNNELERPHIVMRGGRYHLFWSTQRSVFAPGIDAPTGLYGVSADALAGPWRPLNGSGLVVANPGSAPDQAYSWLVLDDGRVASFVDRPAPRGEAPARFVGAPAPMSRARLEPGLARIDGPLPGPAPAR